MITKHPGVKKSYVCFHLSATLHRGFPLGIVKGMLTAEAAVHNSWCQETCIQVSYYKISKM